MSTQKVRLFALAALVTLSSGTCLATPSMYWGSDTAIGTGTSPDIYGPGAYGFVPKTSNWLVQMIETSSSTVLCTGSASFWSAFGEDGVGFDTIPNTTVLASWNGMTVHTRIYNAATIGGATHFADIGTGHTIAWSDTLQPATSIDYNIGTLSSTGWTAIPEPGTLMFSLSALGVLTVRRLRQRN